MAAKRKSRPSTPSYSSFLLFAFFLLLACLLSISVLFIKVFTLEKEVQKNQENLSLATPASCPDACTTMIEQIKTQTIPVSSPVPLKNTNTQTVNGPKEFFVSFGSGTSKSGEWQDVPGLQAYVDKNNYPRLKQVTFEATLYTPTGNQTASVRLYNVTDKHPVWKSELALDGGVGKLITSSAITLDEGNKLYQVQMKTSLRYEAVLNQARLHILTK